VLNRNSGDFLDHCLDSIRLQSSPDWELVLVDNGSTNDSLVTLRKAHASGLAARLIEIPVNTGFAAGMNAGIAEASGDVIVALNSDACVARNFVEEIERTLREAPATTGMIAMPVFKWRRNTVEEGLTTELSTVGVALVRRISASLWHPALDSAANLLGPEGSVQIYTRAALSAASADTGYVFDPDYNTYGEDIDLALRVRALDFHCVTTLSTAAWHIGSATSGGDLTYASKSPRLRQLATANRLRTFAKLRGPARWATVLPWLALEDVYRIIEARLHPNALKIVATSYRSLPGYTRTSERYNVRGAPFAGAMLSRTAMHRRRYGALPPIDTLDLAAIAPRPLINAQQPQPGAV
jgi:GT2 family glycosyltransferase